MNVQPPSAVLPYASPPTYTGLGTSRPFHSAYTRGVVAMSFLGVVALVRLVGIAAYTSQDALLRSARAGARITPAVAAANDMRVGGIAVVSLILLIATAIAFLMWVHRAYSNLPALGVTHLKYTPAWAVGGFFVPFLNLVRPYQVLSELWHRSSPFEKAGGGALITFWWLVWLGGNACGMMASSLSESPAGSHRSIDELLLGTRWFMISDGLVAVAALLAILMVRGINRRQAQRMSMTPAPAPVPLVDGLEL